MKNIIWRAALATTAITVLAGCYSRTETANEAETAAAAPVIPLPGQCDTPTTPFCSSTVPLPPNWQGNVFQLAQNYPHAVPTDTKPWLRYDPRTQPVGTRLSLTAMSICSRRSCWTVRGGAGGGGPGGGL